MFRGSARAKNPVGGGVLALVHRKCGQLLGLVQRLFFSTQPWNSLSQAMISNHPEILCCSFFLTRNITGLLRVGATSWYYQLVT